MDLASDGINRKPFLWRLLTILPQVGWRLMDLTLLMMDLVGSVCQMQERTFGVGCWVKSIHFSFLLMPCSCFCVEQKKKKTGCGGHYSIMRQLNINILNFEYFVKTAQQREPSVQPSFKCVPCESISSHYTIALWQIRARDLLQICFFLILGSSHPDSLVFST